MNTYNVSLKELKEPLKDCSQIPVMLTDETIMERKQKILSKMKERGLEQLIIYGDVEHGSNFEYLVGYFTRFEEALLVIKSDGEVNFMLGNENLNKADKARIQGRAVHVSDFSLPNQPGHGDKTLSELFVDAGLKSHCKTGLVGWKMFTDKTSVNKKTYDLPYYIVENITDIVGDASYLSNETDLFIGENGVRTTNNANEVAHYEYGASLASDCMLDTMNKLAPGITEQELGDSLVRFGQHTTIVTIATSGPRFLKGNMYPTDNKIKCGDAIALTVGYRGGASSRAGYAVHNSAELSEQETNYLEAVAIPYYSAYVHWLETIQIGMTGGELFDNIENILPRARYNWYLCPGHLTAEEEWMSSPVYENSGQKLSSGMIFQIDIIPAVAGYAGVSAESTVLLADEQLINDIKTQYPDLWSRILQRRKYITETLGINLSPDVLPMCSTVAYLRPFLLNKTSALACN